MTDPEQTTASKRQEAEGQTLADQKYLDAVLAHSHDGISLRVVDEADGFHRIVFCNDRYVEMSGYTRPQLMEAEDVRKLERVVSVQQGYRELKKRGLPRSGVSTWLRPDGRENYYEWNCVPVVIDGKQHQIGIDRDITERIIAERNAEERGRRLDFLLKHSFDGVSICKLALQSGEHKLVMCNDRFVEMSGYSREELMASPNLFRLTQAVEKHPRILEDLSAGKSCRGVSSWKRPDGRENYYEWTAVATELDGETHVIGIDRDITERVLHERELRSANEKLEAVIDFLPDPTLVLDRDKRIVAWNRALEELTGFRKERMLGKGDYAYGEPFYGHPRPIAIDMVGNEDASVEACYEQVRRQGDTVIAEGWVPFGPDGQPAHRVAIAAPIYSSDGEMVGAIESIRDDTEALEAQAKIEANEQAERSFRKGLQLLHDVDMELALIESPTELLRRGVELAVDKLGFDRVGVWLATEDPRVFQGSFGIDELGRLRNEESARITVDENGLVLQAMALRSGDTVVEDGDLYGERKNVVGKGTRVVAPMWDGEKVQGYVSMDNLISQEPVSFQEQELFRLYSLTLATLYTRKRTRRALQRERDFANTLIETAQVIVLVLDTEGRIVRLNPFVEELTGYTLAEVIGSDWVSTFVPEGERDRMRREFSDSLGGLPIKGSIGGIVTKDGQIKQVEWYDKTIKDAEGNCVGRVSVGIDVTERLVVEGQLRQSQKMEAIGRFSGGIAHDFNNQLTIIKGYSDLLLQELNEENPIYESIVEIDKAARQGQALTTQLLALSRKRMLNPATVNLNDIVTDMSSPLQRVIGEKTELRILQSPDLGETVVDATQVRQALMNLVVNAWDAMPDGGRLTIRTRNVLLTSRYVARHMEATIGPHVLISVRDTGIGMDAKTLAHAFEPFFTTKPLGEGTGLGLPMVYGFAKQSGGHVSITSRPGKGTIFKLYLPRADGKGREVDAGVEVRQNSGNGRTVLVAEDDQAIRKLVSGYLRNNGYSVFEAADGRGALDIVGNNGGKIDMLITDVIMPAMRGDELASQLRKTCPDVPVLFVTGNVEAVESQVKDCEDHCMILPKPFSPEEFGKVVCQLMEQPGRSAR